MQNLSIFIKGNSDADYHRQQVGERGILEQIDFINNILREEGLTPDAIVEFYGMLDRIETSLTKCANDPRTRRAMNAFEVPQKKKPASIPEPVLETRKESGNDIMEKLEETTIEEPEEVNEFVNDETPAPETTQSKPEPVLETSEEPITETTEKPEEKLKETTIEEPEEVNEFVNGETLEPETTQSEPEPAPETSEAPALKKRTKKKDE